MSEELKEITRLCEIIKDKDKEIERLEKRSKEIYEGFMATQEELKEYAEENERLNNIIKEAKEYIEEKINTAEQQFVSIPNKLVDIEVLNKLLKILDKGE